MIEARVNAYNTKIIIEMDVDDAKVLVNDATVGSVINTWGPVAYSRLVAIREQVQVALIEQQAIEGLEQERECKTKAMKDWWTKTGR